MKSRIVGVGASVLDTILSMDAYPEEDSKKKADKVFKTGGGPVGNALVCIAKLGVPCGYLGLLSGDESGRFLREDFQKWGVDTKGTVFVPDTEAFTSFIILSKEKATRTCVFDRGSVPDDPSLVDYSYLDGAEILHLDGNYLSIALEAAKKAKEKGILVSLDAGSLYPNIETLLPYVDILIPSEDFARKLTGEGDIALAIREIAKRYNPKVLVVTEGSKGGTYLDEQNEVKTYASFHVECLDSNGAGDTFHGAFLVAYLQGKSIADCCRFASATSAIKCTKAGVRPALPRLEEVEQFLKDR